MSLRDSIPLQKSKVIKKSIGGMIGILFISGFLLLFLGGFLFDDIDIVGMPKFPLVVQSVLRFGLPVLLIILFCWNPVYQYFYWKRYHYDMDQNNIIIRKGVVAQKEITLPFSRITDVYVDQDMFDVIFGLYDVHISTPTQQSGEFAHIDGVNKEGSQTLRKMILDRINKEES